MSRCTVIFIGHQERILSGDANRPYSNYGSTAGWATRSRPDAFLLIRVPVYGLCDSGRGFWKKVDHDAKEVGLLSSRIFPAFYFHIENGVVDVHVDDFLWACTESGHAIVDRLLTRFEVGRKEEGRLRFCGKQFDVSGHDILLDVADNTRKTTYVEIAKHRNPADPVAKGEEKQLRSVVGSLSWIARLARPDIFIPGVQATVQHQRSYCFDLKRGEQGVGTRSQRDGPKTSLQEWAIQLSGVRRTDSFRLLENLIADPSKAGYIS